MPKRILIVLLALLLCLSLVACKEDPPPEQPPAGDGGGSEEGGGDPPEGPIAAIRGEMGDSGVTWRLMTDGELIIGGTGAMPDFLTVDVGNDGRPWAELIDHITKLTVEEGVTALGELAFKNLTALKSVTLPAGLTALPYAVFENCTALKTVSGGVGLALIDENAFLNCADLTTLSVSTPLARVCYGAFSTGGDRTLQLHFTGSEAEWQETLGDMTIEGGNAIFENATVTCFPRS